MASEAKPLFPLPVGVEAEFLKSAWMAELQQFVITRTGKTLPPILGLPPSWCETCYTTRLQQVGGGKHDTRTRNGS